MTSIDKVGKSKDKQRLLTEDKSKVGSKKVTFDITEEKSIMERVKVEVNEEIRKNYIEVRDLVKREIVRIRRDIQDWIEKLENLGRNRRH